MLLDREGVHRDLTQSAIYFNMAADQGHAEAQYEYGECLFYGRGVDKDEKEAAKYFKLAADKGFRMAQHEYERCLQNGIGVEKNDKEAARYHRMSRMIPLSKNPNIQLKRLPFSMSFKFRWSLRV